MEKTEFDLIIDNAQQLILVQASLNALMDVFLQTEDQKNAFSEKFHDYLDRLTLDFAHRYNFENPEELLNTNHKIFS